MMRLLEPLAWEPCALTGEILNHIPAEGSRVCPGQGTSRGGEWESEREGQLQQTNL